MHVIKTHENIITMRESGCSYGQIAKTLNIPKSTVSSFCLDHGIKPQQNSTKPRFIVCKECGKVFVAKTSREQDFCSSSCRGAYWRREKANQEFLAKEELKLIELQKELQELQEFKNSLDFLPEERDRLYEGCSPINLCRKKEVK